MTAQELYDALNRAGIEFDVVEVFEGCRWLRIDVEEIEELEEIEE